MVETKTGFKTNKGRKARKKSRMRFVIFSRIINSPIPRKGSLDGLGFQDFPGPYNQGKPVDPRLSPHGLDAANMKKVPFSPNNPYSAATGGPSWAGEWEGFHTG